jgi:hypothetical protein
MTNRKNYAYLSKKQWAWILKAPKAKHSGEKNKKIVNRKCKLPKSSSKNSKDGGTALPVCKFMNQSIFKFIIICKVPENFIISKCLILGYFYDIHGGSHCSEL